jgi:hypothetical protein
MRVCACRRVSGLIMRVICVCLCLPCLPSVSQTPPGSLLLTSDLHSAEARLVNLSAGVLPAGPFAFLTAPPDATSLPVSAPVSALTPSTVSAATQKYPLLLPATHSCSYPVQMGLHPTCLKLSSEFTVLTNKVETPFAPFIQVALQPAERFHWKGALWQSFGFLVAEHAFRIANDPYARYLLLHKPFWHDYWTSANQFHMSHWGDGDDFIVNYIGHPMEGAVAGYIFLNNDPKGGSVPFGKSPEYWYSRLKAMTWAAAFSTYFEIGPILSEAAIGNEGGYTYVPGSRKHPKPPTNNTGWVDFVITPTVGTGWIVLEDVIEREVVDRLAKGSTALKYKLLRGSLAPSHTFANIFAGNTP